MPAATLAPMLGTTRLVAEAVLVLLEAEGVVGHFRVSSQARHVRAAGKKRGRGDESALSGASEEEGSSQSDAENDSGNGASPVSKHARKAFSEPRTPHTPRTPATTAAGVVAAQPKARKASRTPTVPSTPAAAAAPARASVRAGAKPRKFDD